VLKSSGGFQPASLTAGVSQTTVATPGTTLTTTATVYNVASKSLVAGTYLVWGVVDFALTGMTATLFEAGIAIANNAFLGQAGGSGIGPDPNATLPFVTTVLTGTVNVDCGPTIVTLSATTTIYLNALATFSAGSATAYGTLSAVLI
jgi:hypothetical protein